MAMPALLTIGELARRTGLSVSAIRFYEARGLVASIRSGGNQRRFARADLRRLSFAVIAQRLGLTLAEIEAELASLPLGRAPSRDDWAAISARIRGRLDTRISQCWNGPATGSTAASAAAACRSIPARSTTRDDRAGETGQRAALPDGQRTVMDNCA